MEEEDIEKAVIAYLKKKGFKQTELAFQEEQQKQQHTKTSYSIDHDIAKHILSFSESENVPAQYRDGYRKIRSWTYSSLDQYKHELLCVLYPVFIHCFMDLVAKGHIQEARTFFNSFHEDHKMMHLRDLQKLEGVLSPSHLEEMEFAHSLRQSKVNIKICQVIPIPIHTLMSFCCNIYTRHSPLRCLGLLMSILTFKFLLDSLGQFLMMLKLSPLLGVAKMQLI
ncbi:Transcription initiation factor TFIID subunit like [Actinidia chinensis var. chinensis]|uniref:Transcription initiation factor TFIID subunit like n=1 Tax=Actinidia chinensis var. chinensis TaxID=1590841 RepID=A0A2R6Q2I0_ACTCC|nr:Transcription initiation factor TFIID subunit like [Actinidia chinensis var. chinensis]